MAEGPNGLVEAGLRTLFEVGTAVGRSDSELLDLFLAAGGPAAELAFAALVEKHGPMVWCVCRDVLRESNDADDAFQATFLVLARRAGEIRKRSSLGSWLHGVALRLARCARRAAARRRNREKCAARPERAESLMDFDRLDEAPILHEEVGRLPEKYRVPMVLCYFEGLTHDQAASQLGWPVGTVRSRLAVARDRLRPRLLRKGVGPSVAILAGAGRAKAEATVPAALVSATIRMASGATGAGTVPAAVAALARKVLREMFVMNASILATGMVVVMLIGTTGAKYLGVAERPREAEKTVTARHDGTSPKANADSKITVTTVESKDVVLTESYVGRIESFHNIQVRAPKPGHIETSSVKEGQTVKKGDLLFQLEPITGGKKTDNDGENKQLSIRAPFDGMIGRIQYQQGSFVREGDSITGLFDNSVMSVAFHVPEGRYLEYMADTGQAKQSLKIELMLANRDKFPHPVKISAIDAKFSPETGTIAFLATFPNPDDLLRHGQSGTILINRVLKDATTIPSRATFEIDNKRYVYVIDKDGVAHRREVVIQAELEDLSVIKNGVEVGDKIVLDGIRLVHDGEKLESAIPPR